MYIEIQQELSTKQRLLLTYRGLPTFFILFSIFLAFIISFSFFHEYSLREDTSTNTQEVNKEIVDSSLNLAEQIHLREIEKLKKSKRENKTTPPFFSLITFVIPLFLLRKHYKKGKEINSIISNGIITNVQLIKKEEISQPPKLIDVYRLTFVYHSDLDKKKHTLVIPTSFAQRFQDEKNELLIYHKNRTESAILVDDLPESISQHIKQNWL